METGRTLNEMLVTLAIIGILSVGAVNGLKYAINKATANRILHDVSLAYGEAKTTQYRQYKTLYTPSFNIESRLPIQSERIFIENFGNADIIIVDEIAYDICNILK